MSVHMLSRREHSAQVRTMLSASLVRTSPSPKLPNLLSPSPDFLQARPISRRESLQELQAGAEQAQSLLVRVLRLHVLSMHHRVQSLSPAVPAHVRSPQPRQVIRTILLSPVLPSRSPSLRPPRPSPSAPSPARPMAMRTSPSQLLQHQGLFLRSALRLFLSVLSQATPYTSSHRVLVLSVHHREGTATTMLQLLSISHSLWQRSQLRSLQTLPPRPTATLTLCSPAPSPASCPLTA